MKHFALFTFLLLITNATILSADQPVAVKQDDLTQFVDPLVDTHESRWFYFNSASRPFGMVNLSPDTQTKGCLLYTSDAADE